MRQDKILLLSSYLRPRQEVNKAGGEECITTRSPQGTPAQKMKVSEGQLSLGLVGEVIAHIAVEDRRPTDSRERLSMGLINVGSEGII